MTKKTRCAARVVLKKAFVYALLKKQRQIFYRKRMHSLFVFLKEGQKIKRIKILFNKTSVKFFTLIKKKQVYKVLIPKDSIASTQELKSAFNSVFGTNFYFNDSLEIEGALNDMFALGVYDLNAAACNLDEEVKQDIALVEGTLNNQDVLLNALGNNVLQGRNMELQVLSNAMRVESSLNISNRTSAIEGEILNEQLTGTISLNISNTLETTQEIAPFLPSCLDGSSLFGGGIVLSLGFFMVVYAMFVWWRGKRVDGN